MLSATLFYALHANVIGAEHSTWTTYGFTAQYKPFLCVLLKKKQVVDSAG